MVAGLVYSVVSPGILPYCLIYFGIFWVSRRYQVRRKVEVEVVMERGKGHRGLVENSVTGAGQHYVSLIWIAEYRQSLYVFERRYESGGLFWPFIFDWIMVYLVVFGLFMAGVFLTWQAPTQVTAGRDLRAQSHNFCQANVMASLWVAGRDHPHIHPRGHLLLWALLPGALWQHCKVPAPGDGEEGASSRGRPSQVHLTSSSIWRSSVVQGGPENLGGLRDAGIDSLMPSRAAF